MPGSDLRNRFRIPSLPPGLLDLALAAAATTAVCSAISVASEPQSRPPDLGAYALGLVMGLLLLFRRRWPVGVLLATVATLFAYYLLDYPGVQPGLPLAAALYSVALAGRLGWAVGVAGFFTVLSVVVRRVELGQAPLPLLAATVNETSLYLAVILLGHTVHNRRQRLAQAQEQLARSEAERANETARRVAEERLRIAREMHDVLAHTISAITVQAGFAADIADTRPAESRAAVHSIRDVARKAMAELRSAVGVLRTHGDPDPPLAPAPGLSDLDDVIILARQAGLLAEFTVPDDIATIPSPVDLTAYRIVQESLTNTVRHANARSVTITIRRERSGLDIDVTDDGRNHNPQAQLQLGHGITGMAERASAMNGTFHAGPLPSGGFQVHAWLPIEEYA